MHELARVTLDNEMDLILAHRKSMRLAELTGLSLSAQTTFATAVSEVSRSTIENGTGGCLILNVHVEGRENYIVACLKDDHQTKSTEGLEYAKRLVNNYRVTKEGNTTSIELLYSISPAIKIDFLKLDEWRNIFRNEPAVSPYDELKRKNEQLQELSERLQKSEAQYKTLTNSLPMIIFSIDEEGKLVYSNEWLTKLTGESPESLNKNEWKNIIHPEDYISFTKILHDLNVQGSTVKTQARILSRQSQEYVWHEVSLTPIATEKKNLQYMIGYIVDIHAQKVLEDTLRNNEELKRTQESLREKQLTLETYIEELGRSNRELQQFAFVASHDLQEPVRKILFYSDYLLSRHSSDMEGKSLEFLKSMQAASQRMRSLILDLLTFSQINKEQIVFDSVDLNEVVKEALADFEMAIEEKEAKVEFENLPLIRADKRMMLQLFENIISNALKYSRTGVPPRVAITAVKKGNSLQLSFKDNGIGFDERYLKKMFTLFQRLHGRESFEGTGLGLAICSKIVEMHGGMISAQGKEGEGAVFHVTLPIGK